MKSGADLYLLGLVVTCLLLGLTVGFVAQDLLYATDPCLACFSPGDAPPRCQ